MNAHLTLILGGVSSGKSVRAEEMAQACGQDRLYLATAQSLDDEMAAKIRIHQSRRGEGWSTQEAPFDLVSALKTAKGDVILIDCLSMWLSNHLLAGHDLAPLIDGLIDALADCPVPIIAVSNEVGLGGIEANSLARQFATQQGRLNQRVGAVADRVELVTAGLSISLKGGA